jgi:hypothetical protein
MTTDTIFLIAALICFVLSAFGVKASHLNLTAAGLALFVCAFLF